MLLPWYSVNYDQQQEVFNCFLNAKCYHEDGSFGEFDVSDGLKPTYNATLAMGVKQKLFISYFCCIFICFSNIDYWMGLLLDFRDNVDFGKMQ